MIRRILARRRRGQGMTEYIIIVGLIAIVLITAVTQFSGALEGAFKTAESKVGGVSKAMDKGGSARTGGGGGGGGGQGTRARRRAGPGG